MASSPSLAPSPSPAPGQELDIIDHSVVSRWLLETAKHDPEGFVCLTRGNRAAFLALWGAPSITLKATPEAPWTEGWAVTENGLAWLVLTGPTSTCYRLRFTGDKATFLHDPRVNAGAVSFLKQLLAQLNP
jgi:hypothetical protein